jgi:replicative DNA helicase
MDGTELMEIIVDKNRSGRKGIVHVAFDKAHMRFRCIDLRRR